MNEEQFKKIDGLLEKSELDIDSQEMMREFFDSISGQSQFEKIISLLEKFPDLFDNFCKCFILKKEFLAQGKSEEDWNEFLEVEGEVLEKLE